MRKHGVGSVNVIRDETTFEMSKDETRKLAEEHGAMSEGDRERMFKQDDNR
ncbi:MAG: hypothetical protein ACTSW7_00835 [Candidatus Thorarchaeota archaeon]